MANPVCNLHNYLQKVQRPSNLVPFLDFTSEQWGPNHQAVHHGTYTFRGVVIGQGQGSSKAMAKRTAATQALHYLATQGTPKKGKKSPPAPQPSNTTVQVTTKPAGSGANVQSVRAADSAKADGARNKLNVRVDVTPYRPDPNTLAFTPASPNRAVGPSANSSPEAKPGGSSTPPPTPNPFFANVVRQKTLVHVKDDFNLFKFDKVEEASAVNPIWSYEGKRITNNTKDSGVDEDKYGALIRGLNAHIPPGAHKEFPPLGTAPTAAAPVAAPSSSTGASAKGPDAAKVSINAPVESSVLHPDTTRPDPSPKAPSPAPSASQKPLADSDVLSAFREFVMHERQRLTPERPKFKNGRDEHTAELIKFSQNLKLNMPFPDDPITELNDYLREIQGPKNLVLLLRFTSVQKGSNRKIHVGTYTFREVVVGTGQGMPIAAAQRAAASQALQYFCTRGLPGGNIEPYLTPMEIFSQHVKQEAKCTAGPTLRGSKLCKSDTTLRGPQQCAPWC